MVKMTDRSIEHWRPCSAVLNMLSAAHISAEHHFVLLSADWGAGTKCLSLPVVSAHHHDYVRICEYSHRWLISTVAPLTSHLPFPWCSNVDFCKIDEDSFLILCCIQTTAYTEYTVNVKVNISNNLHAESQIMKHTCSIIIILNVRKDYELFYEASILVARSNPQGKTDLLPPHFVWPQCCGSLRMLHPVLRPKGCQRLFFKSHFSYHISLVKLFFPLLFVFLRAFSITLFFPFLALFYFHFLFYLFCVYFTPNYFPLDFVRCLHFVISKAQRNDAAARPWCLHASRLICAASQAEGISVNIYIISWTAQCLVTSLTLFPFTLACMV